MAKKPILLRVYSGVLGFAGPLLAWALLNWRRRKGKEMLTRIGERRGRPSRDRPEGLLVWVHAASVGEFVSVLPLVEALVDRGFHVLLTTGTISSARLAAVRLPPEALHQFVPLDVPRYARRFYDHWQPDLVIFTESELWPNLFAEAETRNIPLVIANARMSQRSYDRWAQLGSTIGYVLKNIDLCLAQTETDGRRLAALGAVRVETAGNLKFDVPPPPAPTDVLTRLQDAIFGRPVFLAASTHTGEDELVIRVHARLKQQTRNLLTIIVPRHPDRAHEVLDAAEEMGLDVSLRSYIGDPDWNNDIFVADTIGELGLFYRVADVAFVGGSLVEHGGQNPIEPAKLGVPILHGPHVSNFAEIYKELDAAQGSLEITDNETFAIAVSGLIADPATRDMMRKSAFGVLERNGGALETTLAAIEPYLMQMSLTKR
ncbi:3-deoxy-D-manno-octulosonic acid transferase [Terrihabitans soli]|uniref:3-deoxy-D-manno-octulosonic acid transferase n=1 Tax=Terrihabitans soli TaxID=708113 RepID=A0A6S6QXD1_9HYPH|nr:3-deoxy-D-manno-octulosonic acid transferase [Terrihabitans soli]BCJ91671.1 3-deoxy-D-manno-octulosonic acid transferase [Terrihabitans soli]